MLLEATTLLTVGDATAADRACRAALRLAGQHPSATRIRLLAQRARVAFAQGKFSRSRRWAVDAVQLAEETNDGPGLAHALAAQYDAEANLSLSGREVVGERAYAAFAALGQHADAAVVLNLIGNDRWRTGDLRGAVNAYDEAEAAQRSAGLELHAAVTAYNLALVLVTQARFNEAEPLVRKVLDVFAAAGYAPGLVAARSLSAEVQSGQGDHNGAAKCFRELIRESLESGESADANEFQLLLAETLFCSGDRAGAGRVLPPRTEFASPQLRARATRVHVIVDAMRPRTFARAVELVEAATAEAESFGLHYDLEVARLIRAQLVDGDVADDSATRRALAEMGVVRVPLHDALVRDRIGSRRTS
jgi:tetratricopeptide (TPR) repeat protein